MNRNWLVGAMVVALVATTMPSISEAKRFGGARSSGLQRSMPQRTAPDAPPPKPAQNPAPQQAAAAAPAAAGAAAAGAAQRRSWMAPIAGLAAGLGIAALMSHLGLGEAFGNFLMLALLVVAALALFVWARRRFAGGAPAAAGAGAGAAMQRTQVAWPAASSAPPAPVPTSAPADASAAPVAAAFVPAAFDSEGFTRTAKMIFIRLQAANDNADLDDLRRFTTPELYAAVRLEIQERGDRPQRTEVEHVDAEVLDVADEDGRQVVSVRFTGRVVEEAGAAPVDFDEVWHLVKPHDDSRPWAIAGIEQMN